MLDRNPTPGSEDDHELDILSTLVEVYEDEHYPILPPDPVDAI
jgi:HTH-type transcriptional regulator/antitoxin HigA